MVNVGAPCLACSFPIMFAQSRQFSVSADGDLAAIVTRLQKTFIIVSSIQSSGIFCYRLRLSVPSRKDAVDFESVECLRISGRAFTASVVQSCIALTTGGTDRIL